MQRGLILLFFLVTTYAYSQIASKIIVDGKVQDEKSFRDTLALSSHIDQLQLQHISDGFFFTNLDSILLKGEEVVVHLYKGNQYHSRIEVDRETKENPSVIFERILNHYSANGYPFVQIRLDSISFADNLLSGKIAIEKGPEIVYDSAFFLSALKTEKKYIYQLLDIVPGTLFSEPSYQSLNKKIDRVSFLKLNKPVDISFRNDKAMTFLDLEEDETNTFQGILGLQQGQNGSSEVVGSLDLTIDNLFNSGKELDFFWERYGQNSQRLNLSYHHPFFLDSKISPNFSFDILKEDSIFITRSTGIGINTFVSSKINLSVQFQRTIGTLLSTDESLIISIGVADFDKNEYKIELRQGFLQKLGGYEKGIFWRLNIGTGRKVINRNLNLQDSFYDTIQLQTNFFQSEIDFAYQLKIWKRQALFHHFSGGIIQNRELLTNELYRPGGFSSVRGFNEKLFFADKYLSSRLEFRSFFENRSYLYVLYDQLIYTRNNLIGYPSGIGIGFALSTSSGQFSFALASGKSKNQEVNFLNMIAHFGYISRF